MTRVPFITMQVALWMTLFGCNREPQKGPPEPPVVKVAGSDKANLPLGEPKKGIDPTDASIVYDEPYTMNTGAKIYNGCAYDKCSLWVPENSNLVVPDKATVIDPSGDDNIVHIYMEKRAGAKSHGDESFNMVLLNRPKLGCAVKVEKGSILIRTFGEWGDRHSVRRMRLVVVVPAANLKVTREEGLIGEPESRKGPNAMTFELGSPLKKTKEGSPNCYLLPASDNEWHGIPAVADTERSASKEKTPAAKDDR